MKTSIFIIIFILSTQLIIAQKTCKEKRYCLEAYKELVVSYTQDSIYFTKEMIRYKNNKKQYRDAKEFYGIILKDKATAVANIKKLTKDLQNCID